tara:strand:- start:4115 stop:4414 length:300 start_codon:yes stop_codon:yes gene_type:complete
MSKKPYKSLLGNRIYLELPKKDESKIIVDENTKEALQKELMKKMSKLKVYDVGNTVDLVKAGDIVLVDPSKITNAVVIPNLGLDVDIILISPFDVIHVW